MSADQLVGIPYKAHGRTHEGCDCWGLVRLAFAELMLVDIPSYADEYKSDKDLAVISKLIAKEKDAWRMCPWADFGTVALFKRFGAATHVGFCLNRRDMLHVLPEHVNGAQIERFDTMQWHKRLLGVWAPHL